MSYHKCPHCGESVSISRVTCSHCHGKVCRGMEDRPQEKVEEIRIDLPDTIELNDHEREILGWYCEARGIGTGSPARKNQNGLVGADRRGGKGYRLVPCERCGEDLYVSRDSENGTCGRCLTQRCPWQTKEVDTQPQPTKTSDEKTALGSGAINLRGLDVAAEQGALRAWRESRGLSQSEMASTLEITRWRYQQIEGGVAKISTKVRGKIIRLMAENEKVSDLKTGTNGV